MSATNQRNYSVMTLILYWSGIAVMSSLYVTIPLLSIFADTYGISLTQAAATGSVFSLGFAIGCLIYGVLSDKYGRKKIILIGLMALTFISFLLGTVDHFSWIVVLRGLQGAAAATFSPVALAYAVEMFPADKRVTAIGFISTGFLSSRDRRAGDQRPDWPNLWLERGVLSACRRLRRNFAPRAKAFA